MEAVCFIFGYTWIMVVRCHIIMLVQIFWGIGYEGDLTKIKSIVKSRRALSNYLD